MIVSSAELPPAATVRAILERKRTELERQRLHGNIEEIRARCTTFYGFVCEAWRVLEPRAIFVPGWHIEAICAHLEAVTDGRINRLLINVPPGSMKSLLVSVLWPAWEWGPRGLRSMRYLTTAFNEGPVKRDTRKCRDLIMSEWFQTLWPMRLPRTAEMSFANAETGTREGVAFGSLTSQRGDRLIIDDPHSVETAESDTEREKTTRKFREGALNRLNDHDRSAIVVIMQRLHELDISGVIKTLHQPYVHLRLPMRFEAGNRCETEIGFSDPRTFDGELLCPARWNEETTNSLELDMGAYAFAGQYQQRPAPRGGGLFKREWFDGKFIDEAAIPQGTRFVRHWDLAGTTGGSGAYTAGVKMGKTKDGRYIVAGVIRMREDGDAVRRAIRTTAELDTKKTEISLPQDPGQAGKVQAADFLKALDGFVAHAEPETGHKKTRAAPFATQCEAGNVLLVRGHWNSAYIDELCAFPTAAIKDQVDASSGAYGRLLMSKEIKSSVVPLRL